MSKGSEFEGLQQALGYSFTDLSKLEEALTHSSMAGLDRKAKLKVYERLEFLGDRVLGLVIAEWLLERFPDEPEGALARRHTALVRAETLAGVGKKLGLAALMRVAPSEQGADGGMNPALLADACEAVIGAMFQDGGLDPARRFIRSAWEGAVEGAAAAPPQDPKTALQEWAMGRGLGLPVYETVARTGPDHAPEFEVRVTVKGYPPVSAKGASKRIAEKQAAGELLRQIGTGKA